MLLAHFRPVYCHFLLQHLCGCEDQDIVWSNSDNRGYKAFEEAPDAFALICFSACAQERTVALLELHSDADSIERVSCDCADYVRNARCRHLKTEKAETSLYCLFLFTGNYATSVW